MKKRLIYFFVIFILILTILPNISLADAYGDFQYSDNGDGTCAITDYTGSGGDLVIPSTINGLTVTDIANYSFYNKSITSITFPANLDSIGDGSFTDNSLTSVNIPDSVQNIGVYAFNNNSITTVVIGSSVNSIGSAAFNKNQITSVTGGGTSDGIIYARNEDSSIDDSTIVSYGGVSNNIDFIPNSVTYIGHWAFRDCGLTAVTIPYGIESIGVQAFNNNSLTSVTIPDSVTFMGGGAFSYNDLTSVTISSNLTSLEGEVFDSNSLISVIIPSGITSIGSWAFSKNALTTVTIPENVTSIGLSAFGENLLETVSFGSKVSSIDDFAFTTNSLTSVTLPDSVKSIGYQAFYNNDISTVTLGSGLMDIGEMAFNNNQITSVAGGGTSNGIIYARNGDSSIDDSSIVSYGGTSKVIDFIPGSVTSIGQEAFASSQLTSVTLPDSIEDIANYAFIDNALSSVSLPNSIIYIGEYAFDQNEFTTFILPTPLSAYFTEWICGASTFSGGDTVTAANSEPYIAQISGAAVTSITVTSTNDTVVKTETLQMSAEVLPADADDKSVTWSVENGTGEATIDQTGLLTGTSYGTVTVKATANDGSNVTGEKTITIVPFLGEGTEVSPYLITNKEQLNEVRSYLSDYFRMENDIVFAQEDFAEGGDFYNGGAGWEPIGSSLSNPFIGVFNGNGYTIVGLYCKVNGTDNNYAGLFGYNRGTIENIGLVNGEIIAESYLQPVEVGSIAGYSDGSIRNCYNTGSVNASLETQDSYGPVRIGGIVGVCKLGTISDCYNTGSVRAFGGVDTEAGGIVGLSNYGIINNCFNTGSVSHSIVEDSSRTGGIVGHSLYGAINNSYNTGIVSVFKFSAETTSYANVGGIVGYNERCEINDCYNIGIISTSSPFSGNVYAGGIVGTNYTGSISSCYYLNAVTNGIGYGSGDVTALSMEEMELWESYAGFDFSGIWEINNTAAYTFPTLSSVGHVEQQEDTTDFEGGNGTVYNPYQIRYKEQLNNVRNDLSASYVLIEDIDFTQDDFTENGDFYNSGAGWAPIGISDADPFRGNFNGNDHIISGLYCNISSTEVLYVGLFGYNIGTIISVELDSGNIIGESTSYVFAAGIVGYNDGTIDDCSNIASVISSTYAGGITGSNLGTISYCYNQGGVSSISNQNACGGITGNNYGTISNCYNTGSVNASSSDDDYAGGIAGINRISGNVINCYNIGSVSSSSSSSDDVYAGGLLGYNLGTISNGYNTGSLNASSYGAVYAGGIAGYNSGPTGNCYYLDIASGGVGDGMDAGVALTAQQMKLQGSFPEFDFDTVWTMDGNDTYALPELQDLIMSGAFVTSITVMSDSDIVVKTETLQMSAEVLPADADNISVTWSVVNGTGEATIDQTGLLTGTAAGTVTVKATASDGSLVYGTKEITVTPLLVSSITVDSSSSAVMSTETLQMSAEVLPADVDDASVTWSVIVGTGEATIDQTGLLTGTIAGTVTVRATANDGSGIIGEKTVTVLPSPDTNGDEIVDMLDVIAAAQAYSLGIGDDGYDLELDMNGDGAINLFDLIMIAKEVQ